MMDKETLEETLERAPTKRDLWLGKVIERLDDDIKALEIRIEELEFTVKGNEPDHEPTPPEAPDGE